MRGTSFVLALLVVVGVTTGVAIAQNAHYVRGPTLTVDVCDVSVSFKAAGLGDQPTVVAALSVDAGSFVECVCANKGNQVPNSANKQTLEGEIAETTLAVRNGQTTGSVSFTAECPADFSCPPGQTEVINQCLYINLSLDVGGIDALATSFGTISGGPVLPTP
jgi:hypothetical protein